jgi:MoxR-like ATPase
VEAENDRSLKDAGDLIGRVRKEMGRRVVGQADLIDGLITGIIAGGHVLVEGVPGLAKTLAVRTLADVISAMFKRIQFTPDLLPADLTGTMIYRQQTGEFVPRKGPVFCNVLLADEINRAPAKVQSALLEAMAEGQVTIGEQTYPLPEPFFVMATQNPIEQEGTYSLPEAQLDRFLIKVNVDYPSPAEELAILERMVDDPEIPLHQVLDRDRVKQLRDAAESVKAEESIKRYIVSLVAASRVKDRRKLPFTRYIEYGASPRATLAIYRCARVNALFDGRSFILPEDIKRVAPMALRHRIVLSYEAEAEQMDADAVVASLLASVSVP